MMDRLNLLGGVGRAAEGIGDAARDVSEVFVPNATRSMELQTGLHRETLAAAAAEFRHAGPGWFDRAINGLNRLPRPMLALGTIGLFVFAMVDPVAFSRRMIGLNAVPEPLWWLLGAIVSFYFGARELHYFRAPGAALPGVLGLFRSRRAGRGPRDPVIDNPALSAWVNEGRG